MDDPAIPANDEDDLIEGEYGVDYLAPGQTERPPTLIEAMQAAGLYTPAPKSE